MSLISLHNISKSFQFGSQRLIALNQISLEVAQKDMLAIAGPSGSGKTTLLNVLGLLDRADTGHYYLNGQDICQTDPDSLAMLRNQWVGFVFQQFHLLPNFNALYNVALPLLYRHINWSEASHRARQSLEQVGMLPFAERYPQQLSGGQQQRVAIARALVGDPDVILADEPTGALDSATSQTIMELLCMLNANGRTIIIVTHDAHIAAQCGKQILMRDGEILERSWQ